MDRLGTADVADAWARWLETDRMALARKNSHRVKRLSAFLSGRGTPVPPGPCCPECGTLGLVRTGDGGSLCPSCGRTGNGQGSGTPLLPAVPFVTVFALKDGEITCMAVEPGSPDDMPDGCFGRFDPLAGVVETDLGGDRFPCDMATFLSAIGQGGGIDRAGSLVRAAPCPPTDPLASEAAARASADFDRFFHIPYGAHAGCPDWSEAMRAKCRRPVVPMVPAGRCRECLFFDPAMDMDRGYRMPCVACGGDNALFLPRRVPQGRVRGCWTDDPLRGFPDFALYVFGEGSPHVSLWSRPRGGGRGRVFVKTMVFKDPSSAGRWYRETAKTAILSKVFPDEAGLFSFDRGRKRGC